MLQIIIILLVVAADLLTKYLLVPLMLDAGGSFPVIGNWFYLTYVENTGASFGMFQDSVPFFIAVTAVVLAAGVFFMIKTRKVQSVFLKISLSLVIGGAVGNFYDRIVFGFVRDFIDIRLPFWRWVFNIADSALVIGSILLGIYLLFIHKEKDGKPLFARRIKPSDYNQSSCDNKNTEEDTK